MFKENKAHMQTELFNSLSGMDSRLKKRLEYAYNYQISYALTLNDFDFEALTVSINKNYARMGDQDLILEPKTPKSKRVVTIPPFLGTLVNEN